MKIRRASSCFDSYHFHANWLWLKALIRLKTKNCLLKVIISVAGKTIEKISDDNQNLTPWSIATLRSFLNKSGTLRLMRFKIERFEEKQPRGMSHFQTGR